MPKVRPPQCHCSPCSVCRAMLALLQTRPAPRDEHRGWNHGAGAKLHPHSSLRRAPGLPQGHDEPGVQHAVQITALKAGRVWGLNSVLPYGRSQQSTSCRPPNMSSFIGSSASSEIWVVLFFFSWKNADCTKNRARDHQEVEELSCQHDSQTPPFWAQRIIKIVSQLTFCRAAAERIQGQKTTKPTLQTSHGNRTEQRCTTQFKNGP